ncbi:hypothetical protein Acy02nite_16450 [Actinoplanes cyaneus]|uniref:FtsX extracellular domain-containing protein n=1 Tax=Actinoplanes cyaneus TaxID=52696 RepID=A0A919IDV4_9ACTN|nr:permease-like cell division protein FtsX [Actinoplanes cyaneus]MCW2142079.1 cell division transport system permease protein [Actinoplanes cyaneus]GID63764.1 hypothetical protein Acy02nite_16450 [Actinoplanes cyaneus]
MTIPDASAANAAISPNLSAGGAVTSPDVPEATAPGPANRTRRPWFLLTIIVVASMLIGAGAATGAFLFAGLPGQPVHHYSVNIYLKSDATADQKAAVEAALPAFEPVGEVQFENRDQAWARFQELFKDRPEYLEGARKESLPESFKLETKGRLFDCAGYTKVRHLPGVDKIQVIQNRVNDYVAAITCDAEYANP